MSEWRPLPAGKAIVTQQGAFYAAIATVKQNHSLDTVRAAAKTYGLEIATLDEAPPYLGKNPQDGYRYIAATGRARLGGAELPWDAGAFKVFDDTGLVKAWISTGPDMPPAAPWARGIKLPLASGSDLLPTALVLVGALLGIGGALWWERRHKLHPLAKAR